MQKSNQSATARDQEQQQSHYQQQLLKSDAQESDEQKLLSVEHTNEDTGFVKFETIREQIKKLFYEDEPLEAYRLLQKLELAYSDLKVEYVGARTGPQEYEQFLESPEIKALRKDIVVLDYFFQELRSDMSSWTRHTDQPGYKVYYRQEKEMKGLTMYLEAEFEAPLMNLFTIMAECQLFKHWIPMTKKSEVMGSVSHLRKMAYFRQNMPWPMSDREIFIQACGIALKEENACILTMSSIQGDEWFGTKINRNPKCVETQIHRAFIYAKSIGENRCVIKKIVNADPHLDYIPQKLINWGMKNVIGVFLKQIQKRCENLPEEYKQLQEEKKDFYDEIQRKICQVADRN